MIRFLSVREDDDVASTLRLKWPNAEYSRILAETGLELSMARGAFVLFQTPVAPVLAPTVCGRSTRPTKSSSRNEALDGKLWDGIGLVTRDLWRVRPAPYGAECAGTGFGRKSSTLATCRRFEVTVLTAAGQYKGDVIVVDHLPDWAT